MMRLSCLITQLLNIWKTLYAISTMAVINVLYVDGLIMKTILTNVMIVENVYVQTATNIVVYASIAYRRVKIDLIFF